MKNKIIILVFLVFLAFFTALDLILPEREFSEWENRALKTLPTLTLTSLMEGEFGSEYEEYISDQFPLRDTFMKAHFLFERALLKSEFGGVYIGDGMLLPETPRPNEDFLERNLSAIDSFEERWNIPAYLLVTPTSTFIYRDRAPDHAPINDERALFLEISKKLENATFIDVMDNFIEKREDYIYFRTDHHWTSEGALIAYNAFLEAIGKEPVSKEDFDITAQSDSFYGTLSSRSGALGITPDKIERYVRGTVLSCEIFDGVESKSYSSIYFDEYLEKKDKYSYYLGTNQPIVRIKTGSDGERIIVFKDSYAHSFSQTMIGDFSEIVLVDLRYVKGKIDTYLESNMNIDIKDYSKALFLYSADTFLTQYNMLWIK